MTFSRRLQIVFFLLLVGIICVSRSQNVLAIQTPAASKGSIDRRPIRFATFNISFNRDREGMLKQRLALGKGKNFYRIAKIIQSVRPDVLLLNEFDYDSAGESVKHFQQKFLSQQFEGLEPIEYPHFFLKPVNTGVDSGLDINRDGVRGSGEDAFGYGKFPGQYGMVVLSKFPIAHDEARTFQKFLWKDMPGALLPTNPNNEQPYYRQEVLDVFRLSSKSHWDVPIQVTPDTTIHFLVSHPTPPTFDGPEDRNGKRNHDEIRLWADYVGGASDYLYDDDGKRGGLKSGERFVIAGDLNADPIDGDSHALAINQILKHPAINSLNAPQSLGGPEFAALQGQKNREQKGNPAFDTTDFSDRIVGNLRIDYCLPSKTLKLKTQAVFWPKPGSSKSDWVKATDHRMVYIDVVAAD